MAVETLVVDNGGWSIKAGWAGEPEPIVSVPNTTARIKRQQRLLVADETESRVKDASQLAFMRPIDRGYLVDSFAQSLIWERLFSRSLLNVREIESKRMLLTAPPFMPEETANALDELAFEGLKIGALCRATTAQLSGYALRSEADRRRGLTSAPVAAAASPVAAGVFCPPGELPMTISGCGVVVDSGFSFTHVTPMFNWAPLPAAIRRLNVGGKLLTNYLKEVVSYRQWNVLDMTPLVNGIKERLCFVAQVYDVELEIARRLSTPAAIAKATAAAAKAAASRAGAGGGSGSSSSSSFSGTGAGAGAVSSGAPLARSGSSSSSSSSSAGISSSSSSSSGAGGVRSHARTRPHDDGSGIGFRREYVLPDFSRIQKGYVRGASDDPAVILKARGVEWAARADGSAASGASADGAGAGAGSSAAASAGDSAAAGSSSSAASARAGSSRKRKSGDKRKGAGSGAGSGAGIDEDDDAGRGGRDSDDTDTGSDSDGGSSGDSSFDSDALPSDDDDAGGAGAGSGRRGKKADPSAAAGKKVGFAVDDDEGGAESSASAGAASGSRVGASSGAAGAGAGVEGTPEMDAETAALALAAATPDEDLQVLVMNHERFAVPEALFRPADIGLAERGLSHAIADAIAASPRALRPALWSSIVLTGGNAHLPGLEARLARELRALAPDDVAVGLFTPSDPSSFAWRGGSWWASDASGPYFGAFSGAGAGAGSTRSLSASGYGSSSSSAAASSSSSSSSSSSGPRMPAGVPSFAASCVTRAEYAEEGARICTRKFRAVDPWASAHAQAAMIRQATARATAASGRGGRGGSSGGGAAAAMRARAMGASSSSAYGLGAGAGAGAGFAAGAGLSRQGTGFSSGFDGAGLGRGASGGTMLGDDHGDDDDDDDEPGGLSLPGPAMYAGAYGASAASFAGSAAAAAVDRLDAYGDADGIGAGGARRSAAGRRSGMDADDDL